MQTVCSSALRRSEAILVPLHISLSGELHSWGEPLTFVGPESEAGTIPGNVGWYRCDWRPEPFDDKLLERPMEFGGGPAPRLHWDRDCAIACCRPSAGGNCSCETPCIPAVAQRVSLAWKEQRLSPIAAADENWGRPCVGSKVPGDRKTLVVFLRFFHFARRFWNHTWKEQQKQTHLESHAFRWWV